ncbi:hypothetical protein SB773_33345, partial [Bacillus sp. SIMBA_074]|uniref:hypothetical protein n=1 Tax=Bacillus sp. SIMBA_074 TaxID=3085812 RepID=UPI00397BE38C
QIFADIERGPKLNLITDEKFKTTGEYISDIGEIYEIFPAVPGQEYDEKQDYLKDLIDEKYKNYFRVYAFDLASKEAAGNVQTIG